MLQMRRCTPSLLLEVNGWEDKEQFVHISASIEALHISRTQSSGAIGPIGRWWSPLLGLLRGVPSGGLGWAARSRGPQRPI